ncbi:hypothetical protein [Diaminobutyricimonas sp. TR449]|uniref:hypothetical protein n=1 Tax=Diaminobutyricimonas sp. TR449 TaxID=2708076 RepID=UPI0014221A88|nr:hypothetical protein [Diaminobutyricimonas sp. TR449]
MNVIPSDPIVEWDGGRIFKWIDCLNLLPELTAAGEDFYRVVADAENEGEAEGRSQLLREALAVGLSDDHAASLAWGSRAGASLRENPDGLRIVWQELKAARQEAPTPVGPEDEREGVSLLTDAERQTTAEYSWWGTRFDAWAGSLTPTIPHSFLKSARWAVLSQILASKVLVPLGDQLAPVALSITVAGDSASTRAAVAMLVRRALRQDTDALALMTAADIEAKCAAARESVVEMIGSVTAIEEDTALSAESLVERQHSETTMHDPIANRLYADVLDGLEKAALTLGNPPVTVYTDPDALARHTEVKMRVAQFLARSGNEDIAEAAVSAFSVQVRSMAASIAVAEGQSSVTLNHELVAICAAEEALNAIVRAERKTRTTEQEHERSSIRQLLKQR